jgi:hypothetical protein
MRTTKKLFLLPLFAVCATTVACERMGDVTAPSLQAPSSVSANQVGGGLYLPDSLEVVLPSEDSRGIDAPVVQGASAYSLLTP